MVLRFGNCVMSRSADRVELSVCLLQLACDLLDLLFAAIYLDWVVFLASPTRPSSA